MQAFLQRVVNGGGRIVREMSAGRRSVDLCVIYPATGFQEHKYPLELKIWRGHALYEKALVQAANYALRLQSSCVWMVLFDQRKTVPLEEKFFNRTESVGDITVHVIGCGLPPDH